MSKTELYERCVEMGFFTMERQNYSRPMLKEVHDALQEKKDEVEMYKFKLHIIEQQLARIKAHYNIDDTLIMNDDHDYKPL